MTNKGKQKEWIRWLLSKGSRFLLFARQQTRSEADAKDVFQDAILKLWKRQLTICEGEESPSMLPQDALVFSAIRQCAIDLARRENRRLHCETKLAAWLPESDVSWSNPIWTGMH